MTGKAERIIELARQGMHPLDIAPMVGTKSGYVYTAIRRARKAGSDIPTTFKRPKPVVSEGRAAPRHVLITDQIFTLLRGRANQLGLTPAETVHRILEDALLTQKGQ